LGWIFLDILSKSLKNSLKMLSDSSQKFSLS
jgi:hypothetical protein